MATYRSIQTSFWNDPFFLSLTPEDKYFYLYLLTNPNSAQCGIYELPYQVMELHTGYNRDTCKKLLKGFVDAGKIRYNEETKEIFILNWLKYNWNNSPKVVSFVKKELANVKFRPFVTAYLTMCSDNGYKIDMVSNQYANGIDTVVSNEKNGTDTVSVPHRKKITVSMQHRNKRKKEVKEKEITTTPTTTDDLPIDDGGLDIWTRCLAELEKKLSKNAFLAWFGTLTYDSFRSNTLIISAPAEFNREWVESRYSEVIKETLREIGKGNIEVKIIIPHSVAS